MYGPITALLLLRAWLCTKRMASLGMVTAGRLVQPVVLVLVSSPAPVMQ